MDKELNLSRKEMEKEARKKDIIDAAAKLFSEKDFHEVKVDDIAERVGLSKGTIYLYFENKECLFFSIIMVRMQQLEQRVQEVLLCDKPFEDCFRKFLFTFLEFFEEHKAFFKIMQSEKIRINSDNHCKMHDYATEAYKAIFTIIVKLIKRGQDSGILRKENTPDLSKILLGILHAYTFQKIILSTAVPIQKEVDQIIDYFLNGVKKK